MKLPKGMQKAAPKNVHVAVNRKPRAKSSRAEKKYEKITGRNPRKGT